MSKLILIIFLFLFLMIIFSVGVESSCTNGCEALASYYVWDGANLTFISTMFSTPINTILDYNPQITNPDIIDFGSRVNVPFSCGCVDNNFMGHQFIYHVNQGDYYFMIAQLMYANLTTVDMLQRFNSYDPTSVPINAFLNVTVVCTCGDSHVSKDYGLFITYPLRDSENLSSIANYFDLPESLLRDYNPSSGNGSVFVPGKDQNGTYPPLKLSSNGLSDGAIAGISIAAVMGALLITVFFCFIFYKRKKMKRGSFLQASSDEQRFGTHAGKASSMLMDISVDKSVEFSYAELAKATDNFSLANKIGQGGFGSVFYGEIRGEKAGIKKMDMQASKEFLAELKILTHVHHLNLVRLIGYCVEGSLFLVYEYVENGNLSQHLRGLRGEPLSWTNRLQIALDSARGLEYIHENTAHVYIHRDIKSANILIDKKFRAKVADFGLAKLTEVGNGSLQTRLVGTFGYMPPEYAQYGNVSPKIDVYALGVVLYELISAKEAIVKTNEQIVIESKGLIALFEDAFNQPDQREALRKLVDRRLGDDYHLDPVLKMANLGRACTRGNPQLRPSMRSIVVALMALSSSNEDWDIDSFYEKQGLVHLMSGR